MIIQFLKAQKDQKHKKNRDVYESGFHTLGGFVSGLLIANFWGQMGLPKDNDTKITNAVFTGQPIENAKGFSVEKLYQTVLASSVMALELFGVKGALAAGTGMFIGFSYLRDSASGKYVGQI